nr:entericidin A/B family lipoprotein [uncultured Albidiferax sp.]
MKKFILLVTTVLVLAGCNTVHGIGQDVQRAGQAIGNAAK